MRSLDILTLATPRTINGETNSVQFSLNGWMMDYSDAQMLGLEVAVGKFVLARQGREEKLEDVNYLEDARRIGRLFSSQHCKGCLYHYARR